MMDNNNNNINQNNNHNNNFRENRNQNERRNEIIRVVQSENTRIRNNNSNNRRQSYDSSENNDDYRRDEPDLLNNCKCDNENCSCGSFICIIMFPGCSTFIIGIKEKNAFWCLLSILNILLIILFFVCICVTSIAEEYYYIASYSFVFVIIGTVFTIYAGIFRNCLIFNPEKPELLKKEKKIISLIYNILIGGTGTLLYGLSNLCDKTNGMECWQKYRHILYGLIQLAGFILLLISFSFQDKIKIVFLVIGILSYCFSLFSGITLNIRCYEKRLFF